MVKTLYAEHYNFMVNWFYFSLSLRLSLCQIFSTRFRFTAHHKNVLCEKRRFPRTKTHSVLWMNRVNPKKCIIFKVRLRIYVYLSLFTGPNNEMDRIDCVFRLAFRRKFPLFVYFMTDETCTVGLKRSQFFCKQINQKNVELLVWIFS